MRWVTGIVGLVLVAGGIASLGTSVARASCPVQRCLNANQQLSATGCIPCGEMQCCVFVALPVGGVCKACVIDGTVPKGQIPTKCDGGGGNCPVQWGTPSCPEPNLCTWTYTTANLPDCTGQSNGPICAQ